MDELSEKLERVKTIIIFIATGPFLLMGTLFLDIITFWVNLYTVPHDAEKEHVNTSVLSKKTVEIFKESCN